jgi:predicted O-linked N-acetylglucosamine transferase (SPINDLY family)
MSDHTLIDLALEHHRAGRLREARDLADQLVREQPKHFDALHLLGVIAYQEGDDAQALEFLGRAAALGARHAELHLHMGMVFLRQGKFDEAAARFRRGLDLKPQDAALHCGLADVHHAQGDLTRAIAAYQRAVALDRANVQAWWGLGCAEAALKEYAASATSLGRLVQLAPHWGEAHHNLGKALFELGQIEPALDAFRKATAHLGPCEKTLGMIAVAVPGSAKADHQAVLEARGTWAQLFAPTVPAPTSPRPPGPANQRLRVGYVSAFFQDRNWMKPVWGLINHHDRTRFEIHLFSDAPESAIRYGYEKHTQDRFHDISRMANAEVARLVHEVQIDILVDLNAYSRLSRLPLFALRPAPVQAAWFNMFATSGMDCFDYLIGDEHVIYPGEEAFYNEHIVRLPGCYLTYEVTYPVPEVAPAPCLTRGHVTFGCLAPQYKITPQVVQAWCRILEGSPGSRLILKNVALQSATNRHFVLDLFARSGIGPERLELEGPAEHFVFLTKYADIDIALDTFPYNGGTTTMEALWQGVPVLTFTGDRWASRISASLMHNADLPEFVAPDLEGFLRRAIELAHNSETPSRLDGLRRGMRTRLLQASVCDSGRFAAEVEKAFTTMWLCRCPESA